jgi:hypothetical protein
MNLIKIQDELNKLPPSPQSIQYLTAAAQGGNPQVPPWMALSRIGEINKEIQLAQPKAQAPSEPLNESLPKQAMQGMGVMGLAPQMQQRPPMQAPQQMQQAPQQAPQMQQRPPMQAPQAPAPQQAPQMQRPQGMAGGGLAGLPVDPRMFEYGSGGVVAFKEGDVVEDQYIGEDGTENDLEGAGGDISEVPAGASGFDPVANLRLLQQQAATQMKQGVRPVRTTEEIEKGLTGARDYGVSQGPVGQEYLQGLAALKAAKEAERGKQQEDIDRKERLAVAKALIAFGEGSRGQKGLGGIGAFGNSYIGSTENLMNERADLRQNAIKTDELLNEANYRVQELRRAQLKGDVAAERNADIALARIARDLGVSQNNLIGKAISGNLGVIGKQVQAKAMVDAATTRAGATTEAATTAANAKMQAAGTAANARRDVANAPPKTGSMAEAAAARTALGDKKLQLAANQAILRDDSASKELKAQARQKIAALQGQVAPAPAARITPEAFNAQWATLTPGQKLVGPDGVTYTKK